MADTNAVAVQEAPATEAAQAGAASPEPTATAEAAPASAAPAAGTDSAQAAPSGQTSAPASAPAEAASQGPPTVEVHPARLPEMAEQTVAGGGGQVDILLNTMMAVTASLGQVTIQVRQLLQLGPGSVVKLERRVGEPLDLFLRGVKFATGQLVVVGEHLGVRIKEILPSGVAEGTVGSA